MELFILLLVSLLPGSMKATLESADALDELPLRSLLKKRSVLLEQISHNHSDDGLSAQERENPVAEALINPLQHMRVRQGPVDRGHFDVEEVDEEEEEWDWMPMMAGSKGKLSGVFDASITALSFLAFGGYLICLIFNVVREKENSSSKTSAAQLYQQLLTQMQSQAKPSYNLRPAGRRRRRRRDAAAAAAPPIPSDGVMVGDLVELNSIAITTAGYHFAKYLPNSALNRIPTEGIDM